DVESGKATHAFPGFSPFLYRQVIYSPDGSKIAFPGGDGSVQVWDVSAQQMLLSLPGAGKERTLFSPDGQRLATTDGGSVHVWDVGTGKRLFLLRGESRIRDIAFSPDGQRLAAACGDSNEIFGSVGDVKIWELTNGQEVLGLAGLSGFANHIAFSQ